ncbi:MAG: hypothetical protein KDD11_11080 [Acidobacteria bacterium]|nr:hypothetical protein [Acidobacteriota bacterium]
MSKALETRLRKGWVVALVLAGCARPGELPRPSGPAPGASATARVETGRLEPSLLLTGELVAERAVEVFAPDVSVRPLEIRWLAEDGSEVHAGDPIVELDTESILARFDDLRLAEEQAQQKLAVTEARVAADVLRAELAAAAAEAQVESARIDASVPAELQPEVEYQERQLALRKAELDLGSARAELDATRAGGRADTGIGRLELARARADLAEAEDDLEQMTVRAPADGVLLLGTNTTEDRRWQVGDQLWPGLALARLPDGRGLLVEARLSDVDDGRLVPGMAARVVPDAFPDLELGATVRSVEGVAQGGGKGGAGRAFKVVLELRPEDLAAGGSGAGVLRPGMSVRAAVRTPLGEERPLVPRSSLVLAGDEVRVVLASGEERPVVLAGCDLWRCAVAGGVEVGERLGRRVEEGA